MNGTGVTRHDLKQAQLKKIIIIKNQSYFEEGEGQHHTNDHGVERAGREKKGKT